jgi:hypothetical protein
MSRTRIRTRTTFQKQVTDRRPGNWYGVLFQEAQDKRNVLPFRRSSTDLSFCIVSPPGPTHLEIARDTNSGGSIVLEGRYLYSGKNFPRRGYTSSEVPLHAKNCCQYSRIVEYHRFCRELPSVWEDLKKRATAI